MEQRACIMPSDGDWRQSRCRALPLRQTLAGVCCCHAAAAAANTAGAAAAASAAGSPAKAAAVGCARCSGGGSAWGCQRRCITGVLTIDAQALV